MDLHMDAVSPAAIAGDLQGANAEQHLQEQHDDEDQQQQQQQVQLTPTVRSGLEAVTSRKQEIHAKIDDLTAVGLQFRESTKINFMQLIESFKKDVDAFCEGVVNSNSLESEETIKAMARLERAQLLVQSLGLEVLQRPEAGMQL